MPRICEILGWACAQSSAGDETGVHHLLVARDDGLGLPYCGIAGLRFGAVARRPGNVHRCRRCMKINYVRPGYPKAALQRSQEALCKDFAAHLDRELWKRISAPVTR